jgi:hypothetical protein
MNIVVLSLAHKINIIGTTRAMVVPNDNRMLDPSAFFVRESRIDIVGKNP